MTVTQIAPRDVNLANVVATRVRGLLAERRMSQAGLAKILGVSQSAMSDRLRGVKDFDINELPVLASNLGASITYLLGLTDERSPRQPVAGEGSSWALWDSNPQPADYLPLRLVPVREAAEVIELDGYRIRRAS